MQHQNQTTAQPGRPYRSHLKPACLPCRRRKSRCQTEQGSVICVTCRAHSTECTFPAASDTSPRSGPSQRRRRKDATLPRNATPGNAAAPRTADTGCLAKPRSPVDDVGGTAQFANTSSPLNTWSSTQNVNRGSSGHDQQDEQTPTLGSAEEAHHNMHIVGPEVTNDSQVLSDYLSGIPEAVTSTRMVIPESASRSKPILFTLVQKRPLGQVANRSVALEKLDIIEKILEPYTKHIIDEYFQRVNYCMPLLDELAFRDKWRNEKDGISPALLACLYAHTLVYWPHSSVLSGQVCPDRRFIWNLANEAVYSELYLSPGMSIIMAILLNVGGRPTTSIIGNGVLLGSAVSIAHSLGLNHNPLPWKIPQSEKFLRMKIWWSLLIHDRWFSLAHGTPPRISRPQYDVPLPKREHLCLDDTLEDRIQVADVFIALVRLTDVLDQYLQHTYDIDQDKSWDTTKLEQALNNWVDGLPGTCRLIIIRGSKSDIQGAANLRLAYLTTRLLLQRIELEADKRNYGSIDQRILNRYTQARHTAEDILLLLQELQADDLGGFWLSVTAFAFPATVNFLLRCALETESSLTGLAQSGSFLIARDIITALRSHKKNYDWDLADICLAQHADIVDKILAGTTADNHIDGAVLDLQELDMLDVSILDQYFPSLWDPLQHSW
ncbi:hypothetical protein QQS21_011439 [Conoideocrella luteorostrata]|uniref:Zn(2)-C6 fungal-type domain-containing protein n=1 Tax=Conoideocrella luteorostrata TaxID=1105319 RepID=A0AAJ0FVV5_9HYPO|nr:hypothetical protein QQS21_011439 [Conoideocrella luteorostrata]